MKKVPAIVYVLVGAIGVFGIYYYLTSDSYGSEKRLKPRMSLQANVAPVSEEKQQSKLKAYQSEAEENKEKEKKLQQLERMKSTVDLTESFDALASPLDRKIEETKKEDILAPRFARNEQLTEDDSREKKPAVLKASLPTRSRKLEVSQAKDESKDESAFNLVYSNGQQGDPKVEGTTGFSETNAFKAEIYGQQQVTSGGLMRFRLLEDVVIGGKTIPRNTIFSGTAAFTQDRLHVSVSKLPFEKSFVKVNFLMHDPQMERGLYAPINLGKEAASESASNSVGEVGSSIGGVGGLVTQGVVNIARGAVRNSQTQKVTVADRESVVFIIE
jgi:hypothetical protein